MQLLNRRLNIAVKLTRNRKTSRKPFKKKGNAHGFLRYSRSGGLMYHKFFPKEQVLNKEFYFSGFYTTISAISRAGIVNEYKAKPSIHTIDQPPYSPDLAPCDFSYFPDSNCHSCFAYVCILENGIL